MRTNCLGLLALGVLLSGCASIDTVPTTEEKLALASSGKLRAAMVITNPVHVTKDPSSGELKGVAIDLGKEMARRLGVPFEVVGYSGGADLVASAKSGQWDIVFIGVPVGQRDMDLSAPYVQIEMGYLVPKDSPISKISEIDSRGIRIAMQEKGGADTLLTPTIKEATLVRRPTIADAVEAVRSGNADAMAAIKTYLIPTSERLPGSRVLEGGFAVEQTGIGVPKGNPVGAAYVRRFVEEVKAQGLVKAAIERAGVPGLDAAP
jgi:polar amino acid transport system substrate-binding protein